MTEIYTFLKMPGIEDWISSPLTIVDQAFQSHIKDGAQWPQTIEKYFEDKIGQDNNVQVKKLDGINIANNNRKKGNQK